MKVVNSISELREARSLMVGNVGFVPTMGNLHVGHLSLVKAARQRCEQVVVSIYVNPMQFDDPADLAAYPHTLAADITQLEAAKVDLLFLPDTNTIYPQSTARHTAVDVPGITRLLEGASRPGHFTGVATIVCKLFNLVEPDIALFGKKDYQQLLVIQKMVADLAINIQIDGLDTCREADGLAMSSRNGYLSEAERAIAPVLYRVITKVVSQISSGNSDYLLLQNSALKILEDAGFSPEYFQVCSAETLEPADSEDKSLVVLAAARLGNTRLIDNQQINL